MGKDLTHTDVAAKSNAVDGLCDFRGWLGGCTTSGMQLLFGPHGHGGRRRALEPQQSVVSSTSWDGRHMSTRSVPPTITSRNQSGSHARCHFGPARNPDSDKPHSGPSLTSAPGLRSHQLRHAGGVVVRGVHGDRRNTRSCEPLSSRGLIPWRRRFVLFVHQEGDRRHRPGCHRPMPAFSVSLANAFWWLIRVEERTDGGTEDQVLVFPCVTRLDPLLRLSVPVGDKGLNDWFWNLDRPPAPPADLPRTDLISALLSDECLLDGHLPTIEVNIAPWKTEGLTWSHPGGQHEDIETL